MRIVQINQRFLLREDGKLFNIKTGKEFIPNSTCQGYYRVTINGERKYLHHIVMELFGPPKPGPEYQIDHKNQNRLDNNIDNLRWVTDKENQNNRTNNRPVGKRLCDFEDINEYKRICNREMRAKKKLLAHKSRLS